MSDRFHTTKYVVHCLRKYLRGILISCLDMHKINDLMNTVLYKTCGIYIFFKIVFSAKYSSCSPLKNIYIFRFLLVHKNLRLLKFWDKWSTELRRNIRCIWVEEGGSLFLTKKDCLWKVIIILISLPWFSCR